MDDMILWAVALGVGVLGLLLLAIAGVAATYLNSRKQTVEDRRSTHRPQARDSETVRAATSSGGGSSATDKAQPRVSPFEVQRVSGPSLWAWIKAAVFALIHAGAVSFVLGGVTFFEDLVRANEEIQKTGSVSFPSQLLPRTLSGDEARKSLSQPSRDTPPSAYRQYATRDDVLEESDRSTPSAPETLSWEVVDFMDEPDIETDGLAEDLRSS